LLFLSVWNYWSNGCFSSVYFFYCTGYENYNVLADLDGNNEVDILDISIVAMDYGKTV
jgi:hypothetical protein